MEHPMTVGAGTVEIVYKNRLEDPTPAFELLGTTCVELEDAAPWGQKPLWDRVLGVATIAFLSAGGWAVIIFAIRFFW
jgi:hypothetical protein